jgi:hypothetical protein
MWKLINVDLFTFFRKNSSLLTSSQIQVASFPTTFQMHRTLLLNYGPNFIKAERILYNKNAREIKLNLIQI